MAELIAQLTFRVTEEMYTEVQAIAERERRKPNEVARALLERGLARYLSDKQLFEPENGSNGVKMERVNLAKEQKGVKRVKG